MSKKKRKRANKSGKTDNRRTSLKPDGVFQYGPLRIARYGRFVSIENVATPEQQSELLARMAESHKDIIAAVATEVSSLQAMIQEFSPIEVMHRAAYVLMPLFLKYYSENQYSGEENYALPIVEYLQYLISRTPVSANPRPIEEEDWDKLWGTSTRVMDLMHNYLLTRKTMTSPPTEIDELRFFIDARRLGVRVRRYPVYFAAHLRDSLSPYEDAIREAYGIDLKTLIQGLEQINDYQKAGVLERYPSFIEANNAILKRLLADGLSIEQASLALKGEGFEEALQSDAIEELISDAREKARLALTPAIFDIRSITSLPVTILSLLSVHPGESILTTLTGPEHDDLSPLSPSLLHHKPFLEMDGSVYYFYHSGFEDRVDEIIESDLFFRIPERADSLRRKRDEYLESLSTDLLASIVKPEADYRNVYYPNPDQAGSLTEVDALLAVDDVLFIVEVKAGGLSSAASRGAPDSLYSELSETIGTGQRQSERAEKYLKSAEEVPFFDQSGRREVCRLRRAAYRRVFRVVVTREDLGWVGAHIAILSVIEPSLSTSHPWHVSIDDLRAVSELFQDSELRFVHFLEQRLRASAESRLSQHDEIEHIGLYNKMNFYHELPVEGMDRMIFDASYMRDIDEYFAERYRGETPTPPKQSLPSRVGRLLESLRDCHLAGRFAVASFLLDLDDIGRADAEDVLAHLEDGFRHGRVRSVRMPIRNISCGITLSTMSDRLWQQELIRSAVQMQQARCTTWYVLQLNPVLPAISAIEKIVPGRFSNADLAPGYAYLEESVRKAVAENRPGRNDQCPCGSGMKFKKCHAR